MNSPSASLWSEGRTTARLALPLIIGQVGQMLIGLADTLMLGWLGVTALAACSFANTLFYLPMMLAVGMAVAVSVRVSTARGAGEPKSARAALRHGLYITGAIGVLTLAVAVLLLPFLDRMGQPPEVVEAVPVYFMLLGVSMIPAFATFAVKNHVDAMNRPWPVFWISIGGVALNVVLNYMLIFGHGGFPQLGIAGAGVATLVARLASLVGMLWWVAHDPQLREWVPKRWLRAPHWPSVMRLLRTGWPASMQLLAEISAFVAATLVIGAMGEAQLASHQVALQCSATIFMVPLGLSMALTVRIGEVSGARQHKRMRRILLGTWIMGGTFGLCSCLGLALGNELIAGWFIDDPQVRRMAASLLLVAAAFQFFDTIQVVAAGGLRGLDDVVIPAWISFLTYWTIALPLGWVLSHPLHWGVTGMWWGITLGLTITAFLLGARVWKKTGVATTLSELQSLS